MTVTHVVQFQFQPGSTSETYQVRHLQRFFPNESELTRYVLHLGASRQHASTEGEMSTPKNR
jgi:hypothetical protein